MFAIYRVILICALILTYKLILWFCFASPWGYGKPELWLDLRVVLMPFQTHSYLLTFCCVFVSFNSCCSHWRVFGKTLVQKFHIYNSPTVGYLFFLRRCSYCFGLCFAYQNLIILNLLCVKWGNLFLTAVVGMLVFMDNKRELGLYIGGFRLLLGKLWMLVGIRCEVV